MRFSELPIISFGYCWKFGLMFFWQRRISLVLAANVRRAVTQPKTPANSRKYAIVNAMASGTSELLEGGVALRQRRDGSF